MNLIENLLDSRLETCLEIKFQLTYVPSKLWIQKKKKFHKKIAKLFEDKQNFIFSAWDNQNFKFGGI